MADGNLPPECISPNCNCSARNSLCRCTYSCCCSCGDIASCGPSTCVLWRISTFHCIGDGDSIRHALDSAVGNDLSRTFCIVCCIHTDTHRRHICLANRAGYKRKLAVHTIRHAWAASLRTNSGQIAHCSDSRMFDLFSDPNIQPEPLSVRNRQPYPLCSSHGIGILGHICHIRCVNSQLCRHIRRCSDHNIMGK